MTVVYVTVFGSVFKSHYDNSIALYGISVFIGLLVVNFFTQSTSQALVTIVANGALLQKVRVPFSVFPVSAVMVHVVQFVAASLPVLVVTTAYDTHDPLRVVLLLVPALSLLMLSLGVGFVTSAGYVFFRDLTYFYELLQFVIWISSPVFYPIEIIPKTYRLFFELNPLYPILTSIRAIVSGGSINVDLVGLGLAEGLIAIGAGYAVVLWTRRRFMDYL